MISKTIKYFSFFSNKLFKLNSKNNINNINNINNNKNKNKDCLNCNNICSKIPNLNRYYLYCSDNCWKNHNYEDFKNIQLLKRMIYK